MVRRTFICGALAFVATIAPTAAASPPPIDFSAKTEYSTAAGGGSAPGRLALGDLNGDGCNDAVAANSSGTATVVILLGERAGSACTGALGSPVALAVPNAPRDVKLGDLDADGCLDIVTANNASSISRFLNVKADNQCSGTFGAIATTTGYQQARAIVLADVDTDGCLDAATADWNYGGGWENPSKVSVFRGNRTGSTCAGTFLAKVDYSIGAGGQGPLGIDAGDVNADGCLDLVTANRRSFDNWSVLLGIKADGSCTGTFATGVLYPGVGKGEAEDVALTDLNEDGHLDLVGVTTGQEDSPVNVRLGGDGSGGVAVGSFRPAVEYAAGTNTNPEVVSVADVNNDGHKDVIIGYFSASKVSVYAGNGDGTLQPLVSFDTAGSTTGVALADMNSDRSPDIVAANRTTPGTLSVLLNQTPYPLPQPDPVEEAPTSAPQTTTPTQPKAGSLDLKVTAQPVRTRYGAASRFTIAWTADGAVPATSLRVTLPVATSLAPSPCASLTGRLVEIDVPSLNDGRAGSCTITVRSATSRAIRLRVSGGGDAAVAASQPVAATAREWTTGAVDILTTGQARATLQTTLQRAYLGTIAPAQAVAIIRSEVAAIRARQLAVARRLAPAPPSMRAAARLLRQSLELSRRADLALIAWLGGAPDAMQEGIALSNRATAVKQRLIAQLQRHSDRTLDPAAI